MDNVIDLFVNKIEPPDIVMGYMGSFIAWAAEQNIDVYSTDFKYDAAAIMSIIQSMIERSK